MHIGVVGAYFFIESVNHLDSFHNDCHHLHDKKILEDVDALNLEPYRQRIAALCVSVVIKNLLHEEVTLFWSHHKIEDSRKEREQQCRHENPTPTLVDMGVGGEQTQIIVVEGVYREGGEDPDAVQDFVNLIIVVKIKPVGYIVHHCY